MSTSRVEFVNNTLFNGSRELRVNWTMKSAGGFTQYPGRNGLCVEKFAGSPGDPDPIPGDLFFPNDGRCPNEHTAFEKNIIIDNLRPGYGTDRPTPLVKLYGAPPDSDMKLWRTGCSISV